MKRRLIDAWVPLWTQLGVRPIDIEHMTLDDALVAEIFAESARAALRASRRTNRPVRR